MAGMLTSAADRPPPEPVVALPEADLERFAGRYTLIELPDDFPADGPSDFALELTGSGSLLGCAGDGDDSPVVFVPVGPDRFRGSDSGGGYMYAQFDLDGDQVTGGTLSVAGFELVYERVG
jgi:hypothetical protein